MSKRRIKRFKGVPDQHRAAARKWGKQAKVVLEDMNRDLKAGRCVSALASYASYARISGRFAAEKNWAHQRGRPRTGASWTTTSNLVRKIASCFKQERR